MFYAKFNANGKDHAELYHSWDKYYTDSHDPNARFYELIDFTVRGSDYQSRKNCLYNIAVEWSNADTAGLYLDELCEIDDWFFRMGKRYGLRAEFKENAIGY